MLKFRWKVAALAILTVAPLVGGAVVYSQSDSAAVANAAEVATGTFDGPLAVHADVSARQLTVYAGDEAVRSYPVAVGKPSYPTPKGTYKIRKIVWNPSWTPPPNSEWAKNKTAKDPGEKGNPMKVVKIFFRVSLIADPPVLREALQRLQQAGIRYR